MRAVLAIHLAVAMSAVATAPACGDDSMSAPAPEPRLRPVPGDAECAADADCVLLPYVTCCGECAPAPPFEVGTREDLDAILIESEQACAEDLRPCASLSCDPVPTGCWAKPECQAERCVVVTDGCKLQRLSLIDASFANGLFTNPETP